MAGVKVMLQHMGREMKAHPPKMLAQTARKFGVARAAKQRRAILLSKARRAGARIPR